jgi:hypothetical protein
LMTTGGFWAPTLSFISMSFPASTRDALPDG